MAAFVCRFPGLPGLHIVIMPPTLLDQPPPLPPAVEAVLLEEWGELDPTVPPILEWMKQARVFHQFAHARDPFIVHLRGTWCCRRRTS